MYSCIYLLTTISEIASYIYKRGINLKVRFSKIFAFHKKHAFHFYLSLMYLNKGNT